MAPFAMLLSATSVFSDASFAWRGGLTLRNSRLPGNQPRRSDYAARVAERLGAEGVILCH